MKFDICAATRIFITALAFSAPGYASASSFEISPVVLDLTSARPAGTIQIINRDDHEISIQLRAFDWRQVDGNDLLDPTPSLILSPPVFTLAAGASQVVRVVSRVPAAAREGTFRLLIDEIPTIASGPAINFKFRISMPVFVQAEGPPASKLEWKLSAGKTPQLTVNNLGSRRVRLLNLALTLPDGKKITAPPGANPYTLSGITRNYPLQLDTPLAAGSRVSVSALTDSGAFETSVAVAP